MSSLKTDGKEKFSHDAVLDEDAVVGLLEGIVAGVRAGELVLRQGEEAITVGPCGPVSVTLRAKRKSGRESLRLELEWEAAEVQPVLEVGRPKKAATKKSSSKKSGS